VVDRATGDLFPWITEVEPQLRREIAFRHAAQERAQLAEERAQVAEEGDRLAREEARLARAELRLANERAERGAAARRALEEEIARLRGFRH